MSGGTTRTRVLIIDDHPVIRYGVKHMLSVAADIEIAGELESISELGKALVEMKPDVVLLDLELGDAHGVDALRQLRAHAPSVRVVIYTSHDEEDRIVQAAQLGVDGYLLKGCPQEELVQAIRSVSEGGTALQSSVASKLMKHMNNFSRHDSETELRFSKREMQVLRSLASGKTNREIGDELFISESTVKFHVHAIFDKLEVSNRTEAVTTAAHLGIIELSKKL